MARERFIVSLWSDDGIIKLPSNTTNYQRIFLQIGMFQGKLFSDADTISSNQMC